jgi:hypothetical protein
MLKTILILLLLLCFGITPLYAQSGDEEGGVPMELVVKAIKDALRDAETVEVPGFDLELSGVTVQLKTVVSRKKGGEISFWIFSFGSSKTQEASSTITIELSAPKPTAHIKTLDVEGFSQALTGAIVEAKRSYAAASTIDPKLSDGKATLEFKFAVATEHKGGAKLTRIIPVGIEVGGSRSASHVHTITLKYTERTGRGTTISSSMVRGRVTR